MALGQSRQRAAADILIKAWRPELDESLRRSILLSLALARQESAFEFLFSVIADANEKNAAEAIEALAMYRHDELIRGRVEALIAARKNQPLEKLWRDEI